MVCPRIGRAQLLAVNNAGLTVVARLEQPGYSRLAQLADAAPADITMKIAAMVSVTCWRNCSQACDAITAAVDTARRHQAAV